MRSLVMVFALSCALTMWLLHGPHVSQVVVSANTPAPHKVSAQLIKSMKVPITREVVVQSLKNDALMRFLEQLQNPNSSANKKNLKAQCRIYLVGFNQLPHPQHDWPTFLHDLFAACYNNEFASEIVARALMGQNVLDEQELPLVIDIRPPLVDNAEGNHCQWQALLFLNALDIVFPAAVKNGQSDLVIPFLKDQSSQVRFTAFKALYPKLSAKDFSQWGDFFGQLAYTEQKLLAEKIADDCLPNEAATILKSLVNRYKLSLLGAFCKVAQRDSRAIELLLHDELGSYTSSQHGIIKSALEQHSRSMTMLKLNNEAILRKQLLNAYFAAGVGKNAQAIDLSVVEWIARLDNNPLIQQQAIDFLLTINQGNSNEIANELVQEPNLIINKY